VIDVPVTKVNPADVKRSAIVNNAARLFDTHGYHQTSMTDIAESSGLAKPTLYHYFKSKDEILSSIHDEFIDSLLAAQTARWESDQDPVQQLSGIIGDVLTLMDTHRGHVRTFFEHHRELAAGPRALSVQKRTAYRRMVEAVINRGIAERVFRDVDVQLVTLALFGMVNWSYQWYSPGGTKTAEEITESFLSLVMDGIRS
jgi:TetR/AcrR family transcriptional regulator, cholesterol catabolism regulator